MAYILNIFRCVSSGIIYFMEDNRSIGYIIPFLKTGSQSAISNNMGQWSE